VSFDCSCGSKNKRRLKLLKDGQIVSCINPDCHESFDYVENNMTFGHRTFEIVCRACDKKRDIPKKIVEKLRTDQQIPFDCEGCGEAIYVSWRLMQAQKTVKKLDSDT
jgi:hypothetical protein